MMEKVDDVSCPDLPPDADASDITVRMLSGRTLSYWFQDPYTFSEVKEILKLLDQLARQGRERDKFINRIAQRQFLKELSKAANELYGELEFRVHTMLMDREAVGGKDIEQQLRRLDDPWYEEAENRIVPTIRNSLHVYWGVLGASQTPKWRKELKKLRQGRISLREALSENPLIRFPLFCGVLVSGLSEQLGSRWLHHLEESPEILTEVADAALSNEGLAEKRGRRAYRELTTFVARVIAAAEKAARQQVTATDHNDRRSKTEGISRRTSPGLELIYACVKPLYPQATFESCGGQIRKARKRQKGSIQEI